MVSFVAMLTEKVAPYTAECLLKCNVKLSQIYSVALKLQVIYLLSVYTIDAVMSIPLYKNMCILHTETFKQMQKAHVSASSFAV
jgi:hypothetical protein